MRKSLYLVLSLLVAMSLGAAFLNCGDDGDDVCECEGGAECCDECPDCAEGMRCNFMTGECGDCCADAPENEVHIWVSGKVVDMTTQEGVKVALTPISPMDALTGEDPTHLDDQVSGDDGLFKTNCFDVTTVTLGCVMLTDDENFDGTGGTYFPSGTGVKAWGPDKKERYCVEEAKVFAVPNTLVAALDGYTSVDSAEGFVMGFVVDATFTPVADAVVKKEDGTDLNEVIYPNATFTDFSGTATSATGIFVLPDTSFPAGLDSITAEKTGMTFGVEQAATKDGFCYFTFIQAE